MKKYILTLLIATFSFAAHAKKSFVITTVDDEPLKIDVGLFLSIGGVLQKEAPADGSNGLSVGNARVSLAGRLKNDYGYRLQWDFVNTTSLIDAEMFAQLNDSIKLRAGLFKVPFSAEFLIAAQDTDLVNRSQVVNFLVPNRRVGVELSGNYESSSVFWAFGVFNDSRDLSNSDNDVLVAYRLGSRKKSANSSFEVAANVALSDDDNEALSFAKPEINFTGERFLAGMDFRWQKEKFFVTGELISAWLDGANNDYHQLYGYQVTGAYKLAEKFWGLLRWDSFRADSLSNESDLILISIASRIPGTEVINYQFAYELPTKENGEQRLLLSLDAVL